MNTQELYHYGVPGMKWGVRRYQNADGSLNAAGRKKVSKQYKKASVKTARDFDKKSNSLYTKAYNQAARNMNEGGIDKFNKQQEKKYGKNFAQRDGYMRDYDKLFDKTLNKTYNQMVLDFYSNNKNYKKAQALVDRYAMTKWDDLAKQNVQTINDLRKAL